MCKFLGGGAVKQTTLYNQLESYLQFKYRNSWLHTCVYLEDRIEVATRRTSVVSSRPLNSHLANFSKSLE